MTPFTYINLGRINSADARLAHVRLILPSAQGQSDAVAAYTEGCLTKYASEMEKVHIPAFDADDEDVDSDEDDYPDDDGRFDAYA